MSKVAGALVALVGVLQTTLTAVGTANGGLGSVVLNEPLLAWLGLGLVVLAAVILVIYVTLGPSEGAAAGGGPAVGWSWKLAAFGGGAAIVGGIAVTAYAALAAPALSGEPTVIVSMTWGKPLTLNTTVKANAIKRDAVFHFQV
ncbi:MAG TPA: hypothetical protein VGF47_06265, partial [Solirubrobacteraceae bacterium]